MAIEMSGEIPFEEVLRRVSDVLGGHYQVTMKSDSVIKIRRFPLVTENVHVKWHGDRTALQPAPGGVWIIQGVNALAIHPRVRRALTQAFVMSPSGESPG
jgi:hypothetical protein